MIDAIEELDATGLICPLPVLKLRRRMRFLADGNILKLLTDDPAALVDVPHYCTESGNKLLKQEVIDNIQIFFVQKIAAPK
ncbi:MAG: sulfurtransferase TusA family protein [Aestuariivita sp.]|nr:sulfurtransferase TusA family protein [Aestuariivita sp.]MCY4201103.1 sulfurtransferase TusA family protein [Aestuariivita sp.]MCY4288290.1 sulfurtransferase TusA family protein [Aestuariivita sp.]MCY4345934.1 sulfurtransferase TusA family protein [Aestuariivita sp.]